MVFGVCIKMLSQLIPSTGNLYCSLSLKLVSVGKASNNIETQGGSPLVLYK